MKTHSNHARSLQWQIIYRIAPVAALLLALLALFTEYRVDRTIRQEIQRRVEGAAVQVGVATQEKLRLVLEAARAVAQNDVVVNGIVDLEYRKAISEPFFRSLRLPGASNQAVTLCDYRGRPLISTAMPHNCESESWLGTTIAGNEIVATDGTTLTLAVPVLYAGRAEAIVVATYPLVDFLASVTGASKADVVAFDYSGSIVATSNSDVAAGGKPLPSPQDWLMATSSNTGLHNIHVTVFESESISQGATRTVKTALLAVGVIVALSTIACIWMISRLATQPLLILLRQIEKVHATGDLSVRVTASGADEFMRLGDRFNSMLAELENSTVSRERYQQAKQRLEIALNGGEVGLWDWDTSTDKVYYSPILKTQLGYPGDAKWDHIRDFESRLHPEDRDLVMQAVEEYLAQQVDEYKVTFRLRCQDGSYRWMQSKGVGEFDQQGTPQRLVGIHVDVTDRVNHEQSLAELNAELERRATQLQLANDNSRKSEERLSVAVRGTSDGLWDWNIETNKVWYSPRYKALLGLDRNDEFAHDLDSFSDRLHPDDAEATWEAVASHLEDSVPFDVEYRLRRKAGDYCWFRARGAATRDKHGKANRMAGSIQDVTDSKRYQQALERSNADLEQFAYVSSHDLQEPLRKVASFCELLNEEYGEVLEGDGKVYLDFVVDGARRMQGLIRDLLSFARIKSQGKPLHETCAEEAFDAALSNLDGAIEASQATVTRAPLPNVWADPRQLTQLLQNLISNAIKYKSDDDPQIHVGVDESKDMYTFSVSDNGIGIAPEYHDRIFGIFKRLHGRGEHPGSGIGLAICKQIADRWRGRVWVESEEGSGSTFRFTVGKIDLGVQDAAQQYAFAD